MEQLEKLFNQEVSKHYFKIKKEVYDPKMFYQMMGQYGGLGATRMLLN